MKEKGITTQTVELAGKRYALMFGIDSMLEVETLIQTVGLGQAEGDFFKLLDPPYNVRELIIMIQAGINGKRRYDAGDGAVTPISMDEAKKLVQDHFNHIKKRTKDINEWREAQRKLADTISLAARQGVGLIVESEAEKEDADENPNESPGATKPPSKPE